MSVRSTVEPIINRNISIPTKELLVDYLNDGHAVTIYSDLTKMVFHQCPKKEDSKDIPSRWNKFAIFIEVGIGSTCLTKWPAYIKKHASRKEECSCSLRSRVLKHMDVMVPTDDLPHTFYYTVPRGSESTALTHHPTETPKTTARSFFGW